MKTITFIVSIIFFICLVVENTIEATVPIPQPPLRTTTFDNIEHLLTNPRRKRVSIKNGKKDEYTTPPCFDFDDILELIIEGGLKPSDPSLHNVSFSFQIEDIANGNTIIPVVTNQFVAATITDTSLPSLFNIPFPTGLTDGYKNFIITIYFNNGDSTVIEYWDYINCCNYDNIVHQNYSPPSNLIRGFTGARDYIEAKNTTIGNQQEVRFEAENYILLEPTFSTELGAVFSAVIEDCPSDQPTNPIASASRIIPNSDSISAVQLSQKNGEIVTSDIHQEQLQTTLVAFPNPFEERIQIKFQIGETTKASLVIYNALGQVVFTEFDQQLYDAGNYQIEWNASVFSSGTYFVILQTEYQRLIQRIVKL